MGVEARVGREEPEDALRGISWMLSVEDSEGYYKLHSGGMRRI